ncbi:hypothetical protein [Amycolatopsis pithecellobii]|uniref:Uncharacterized protein n=1 Tax=Amycolatopsis pithecellobii TaxID=664692 RepID=A0A6N7Z9B4_9PSEU|nr:hypothetical protein [Amycolatopsis pithecellobii]MTD58326.1 hypothetical protein [Amycolatopsis pithecellobii]
MTWQEDLRRLDMQLASGEISLREHRKQREELLAAASGGFSPSPVTAPVIAQQPPGRSAALLASDRPTSAPSPADERSTESMRHPTIHDLPTVVTPAIGPLPGLQPSKQQVPPLPTRPNRPSRHRPTWLFLALGVLLVLLMIIGATWFLGVRDKPAPATGAAPVTPSTTPSVPVVPIEQRVPALPGVPETGNAMVSVDQGAQRGLYPAQAAQFFAENEVTEIVYRGSSLNNERYFLLVVHAADAAKAKKVADYMRSGALSTGFVPLPADSSVLSGTRSGRLMNGTWYSSGDLAVILWLSQPAAAARAAQLKQHLDRTKAELTAALPPA